MARTLRREAETAPPQPTAGGDVAPDAPSSDGGRDQDDASKREAAPARRERAVPPSHPSKARPGPDFTIITGLSGAGRSEAARSLEDLGYFVVDNLPPALIGKMAELAAGAGGPSRVAIVADVRGGVFFNELSKGLEELKSLNVPYRILFLEATDGDLVNRFEATRRRHPLAAADRVVEGIRKERLVMEGLRGEADLIIDTSDLTPNLLRERIREFFSLAPREQTLQVSIMSFGYKYGVPRDVDLVLDVRFLPNPYWVPKLRPLPGTDARVRRYVNEQDAYGEFVNRLRALLELVVPGYVAEGKSYLTMGIGCTGGRHRSVVVAEELARFFRERGMPVNLEHRDVRRD